MIAQAVETNDLAKRFRSVWALQNCTVAVPDGRVSGLVGANGAGKTTLMRLLAGLSRPTSGRLAVNGRAPADDADFLAGIGYLAQEVPLYRRWNAADHLALGAHMNRVWDQALTLRPPAPPQHRPGPPDRGPVRRDAGPGRPGAGPGQAAPAAAARRARGRARSAGPPGVPGVAGGGGGRGRPHCAVVESPAGRSRAGLRPPDLAGRRSAR